MIDYQELWNQVVENLEVDFDSEVFNDVFAPCKYQDYKNGYILVLVPTLYVRNKLNRIYINAVNSTISRLEPNELIKVKFILEDEIPQEKTVVSPEKLNFRKNLNANYSFNNFVVGSSNMFAFRMAMKVAEQPGVVANPFYLFGSVGLGKTHLMEAIGNYILDVDINKRVLYVKANEFIEDYSKMCSNKLSPEAYEEKYRDLDVLLIDDIQMLELGKKSQEEFFKIFDILFNENKQIVITSDRPAKELNIMERLTSRFSVGLTADILIPDTAHRINIVKKKLEAQGAENLDNEVYEYIANNFTSNIRELEGASITLANYCWAWNKPYTLETCKEALSSLITVDKKISPDSLEFYNKIIGQIAAFYSISFDDITGEKRNANIVLPRQIAMYLLRCDYGLSDKKIGQLFGNKDHSTVISAVKKIETSLESNNDLKLAIEAIRKKIQ